MDYFLLAQVSSNQQEVNDLLRSARQHQMLGYILCGAGIALIIAYIPLRIYLDRKQKARKRAAQDAPYDE